MLTNFLLFLFSLATLTYSAGYCNKYASKIAKTFHLSEFFISFFIVAVISSFPETTVSIVSALKGVPEFGFGALLGSNVTDLTLVFAIITLLSVGGISLKSSILKNDYYYIILLAFPLLLGLDGYFSRMDGIILVLSNVIFLFTIFKENKVFSKVFNKNIFQDKNIHINLFLLLVSLIVLLFSAYFAVKYGINFANEIHIPAIIISLTVVAIGSCLPELMFSIRAVKNKHETLALGDILGTVIIDATLMLGIVILINPFYIEQILVIVTCGSMLIAGIVLLAFIDSKNILSKKEAVVLLVLYVLYVLLELYVNRVI